MKTAVLPFSIAFLVICASYGCEQSDTSVQTTPPAAAPSKPQQSPIARVLGRDIYFEDIDFDPSPNDLPPYMSRTEARNQHIWLQLQRQIVEPLRIQFLRKNHLEVTDEEIQSYFDSEEITLIDYPKMINETRDLLNSPNLSEDDKKAIAEHLKFLKNTPSPDEYLRAMALFVIRLWKFNRELHVRRGGTVIRCEWVSGREPVEATYKWLIEQEKSGKFQISHQEINKNFWDYYSHDHSSSRLVVHEKNPFRQPPWILRSASSDSDLSSGQVIK